MAFRSAPPGVRTMGLLDPRFRYVPADATDIKATWQRYGFDARRNAERRARLNKRGPGIAASVETEAVAIHPLIRKTA